jgi:hypothetical protein
MADEYLDVTYKLWEGSWEDDAVAADKDTGVYADPAKVHAIEHEGRWFQVPGVHLSEPSPQRSPVIYQAGASSRGRRFAGRHAEAIFTSGPTIDVIAPLVAGIREELEAAGRERDDARVYTMATVVVDETSRGAWAKHDELRAYGSDEAALVLLSGWTGLDLAGHDLDAPLTGGSEDGHSLLATYSLILALLLGTMGLPHVLVRFYTNPDGRAARRTTVVVLAMLGGFYLLPVLLGVLSRLYVPQLLVTGQTDAAVLLLPTAALPGWSGIALAALVAAGAFAAFLSTSSGLLLSVAGVLSTDLLPRKLGDFRIAAHVGGVVPIVAALGASRLDFSLTVSLAFAVAASTFCPLLVLGIWWKGLTDRGATVGMLVGGGVAVAAVGSTLAGIAPAGWVGVLLARPALVTVPLTFLVMVFVSRSTSHRVPANVGRTLLRLHAPERLGLGDARRGARPSA